MLRSFDAPPAALAADADLLRERVGASVAGLLALLGVEADPLRSREHILLAKLLEDAWRAGKGLDLAGLVRAIQSPGIERVGVVDLE
ncbi:MAG TPA: ATP-binding protein, partial [Myxococcota bacterium]|nr:ATP-binding protein [Myxococcota bacterium]